MQRRNNAVIERRFSSPPSAADNCMVPEAAFYRAVSVAADAGLVVQAMDLSLIHI